MKPNVNVAIYGILVTFNWGELGYLISEHNQPYGLQFLSSDIYKEDDCFKCDVNGKICIAG
jgi:hypothetical protein